MEEGRKEIERQDNWIDSKKGKTKKERINERERKE